MNRLKQFVEENGGPENIRFIIRVNALDYTAFKFGLPVVFKTEDDENKAKVAFKIPTETREPQDLYGLDSDYKIELVPDTPENQIQYGREKFYQSDLLTIIKSGGITVTQVEGN